MKSGPGKWRLSLGIPRLAWASRNSASVPSNVAIDVMETPGKIIKATRGYFLVGLLSRHIELRSVQHDMWHVETSRPRSERPCGSPTTLCFGGAVFVATLRRVMC